MEHLRNQISLAYVHDLVHDFLTMKPEMEGTGIWFRNEYWNWEVVLVEIVLIGTKRTGI